MRFAKKTEQELQIMNLIDKGQYQYTVLAAEDAVSKSGKDMIKLQLKVWDADGREHLIYDYLLEAMPQKLKHFADTCGLADKYELGEINADDCKHKSGYLELIIQEDKSGQYGPRNSVKDYIKRSNVTEFAKPGKETVKENGKEADLFNDDIPF